MMFFILGIVCGMWLAQSFTIPNVQATISKWTQSQVETSKEGSPETPPEPAFTGEMPKQ
tara:strand:+ start:92 stop:268 length:177 start_codon:yes stop_codon:yes gene_type:complete